MSYLEIARAVELRIMSRGDGVRGIRKKRDKSDADDPVVWRKATEDERCGECAGLEAQGVTVLACSTCDRRTA